MGKVASFIDDVTVEMETEEEHDEMAEEVVKILAENNLYIKCKQNIREMKFLGVMIGLEEINMEEEKV